MGLFSRKEADSTKERISSSKRRSATPSEAYADDLRGRARRRLIGALALVVLAVIVVPQLITSESEQPVETPVVVPAIPPIPDPTLALNEPAPSGQAAAGADASSGSLSVDTPALSSPEPASSAEQPAQASSPEPEPAAAPSKPEPEPQPKPEPEPKPKPEAQPAPSEPAASAGSGRSDDGSVAIALLEGRKPSTSPAAATRGNFVVQIAAYTSRQDAEKRRDSLVSAGVTNAYVESANPDGKATYRLRVGPFPTREAAQAAQTRLRSLDYTTSFIATQ